jgi:hypothetical protein
VAIAGQEASSHAPALLPELVWVDLHALEALYCALPLVPLLLTIGEQVLTTLAPLAKHLLLTTSKPRVLTRLGLVGPGLNLIASLPGHVGLLEVLFLVL